MELQLQVKILSQYHVAINPDAKDTQMTWHGGHFCLLLMPTTNMQIHMLKMEMENMLTFHCFINYFDSKSISAILYTYY